MNLKSTDCGFKMINHAVANYEQTKKGLSSFYPKREVECDGIDTKPLNLFLKNYVKKLVTMLYLFTFFL